MLIYWINIKFQFRKHLIEFTSLDIKYIDRQLIIKLIKLLEFFDVKVYKNNNQEINKSNNLKNKKIIIV